MEIGNTLSVADRKAWRAWLSRNHATEREIWLIYYKKTSGRPRIDYNHAVEEALCYGWIDSILKPIDGEKYAQRFSPRKPNARWSAMNIERFRRLLAQRKVRRAGIAAAGSIIARLRTTRAAGRKADRLPADIRTALRSDPEVWKNFNRFPSSYQRIRIGWIDASRNRPEFFRKRLNYFVKMTKQNKRFGMVQ